ncbi:MAG: very short patch repair endonuclease [Myxococcota bacterium]
MGAAAYHGGAPSTRAEVTLASRSSLMARIRGRDTGPEELLRSALWRAGLRFRVQARMQGVRVDILFPRRRLAIFVDGCFWHGCPAHYVCPRSRQAFWALKLRTNVERDRRQTLALEAEGWTVFRVWEHEVFERLDSLVEEVVALLVADARARRPDWRVVAVTCDASGLETRALESLRDPLRCTEETRPRTTAKWKAAFGQQKQRRR